MEMSVLVRLVCYGGGVLVKVVAVLRMGVFGRNVLKRRTC